MRAVIKGVMIGATFLSDSRSEPILRQSFVGLFARLPNDFTGRNHRLERKHFCLEELRLSLLLWKRYSVLEFFRSTDDGRSVPTASAQNTQPTRRRGSSCAILAARLLRAACQRSQSCCKPSQKSADSPTTRASRSAVSGVTLRFRRIISFKLAGDTSNRAAKAD